MNYIGNYKKEYIMSKKGECVVIDCPKCGSPAYYGDNGIHCTNPNCPNSRG